MNGMKASRLHDYAHARAGDKGDRLSLGLFVYEPSHYEWLLEQVTEAQVAELFAHRGVSCVRRYPLPLLGGINFEEKPYVTLLDPGKVYTTWFTTTLI